LSSNKLTCLFQITNQFNRIYGSRLSIDYSEYLRDCSTNIDHCNIYQVDYQLGRIPSRSFIARCRSPSYWRANKKKHQTLCSNRLWPTFLLLCALCLFSPLLFRLPQSRPTIIMKVSRQVFNSLVSPTGGPEISFSLYHECLHSIAFTHAKVLSLPHHKFIDPASPANDDGTVSVQFLPHWRKHLLLPLFLCLMHIYIKPQL